MVRADCVGKVTERAPAVPRRTAHQPVVTTRRGYGNSELEDTLRESALLQGREVHPDPNPEAGLYYRSDQLSFARGGAASGGRR